MLKKKNEFINYWQLWSYRFLYCRKMYTKLKKLKKTIAVDNIKSNRFCSLFDLKKNNNLKFFLRDVSNF